MPKETTKTKGKIILSSNGVKLFGKRLLLDENIYIGKMDSMSSLIPIGMDEEGNAFVPRESVPDKEYYDYVELLGATIEYHKLMSAVKNGTLIYSNIETPILDHGYHIDARDLFMMGSWNKLL